MKNKHLLIPVAAMALAVSACGAQDPGTGNTSTAGTAPANTSSAPEQQEQALKIVTTTNVYADIAAVVGGDAVEVQSVITSTAQDPHSYEASAQDRLVLSGADLVIFNGGGYDYFMEQLLEVDSSGAAVISAVEVSGLLPDDAAQSGDDDDHGHDHDDHDHGDHEHDDHDHGHTHIAGFNEHIWYSFPAMAALSEAIAAQLAELIPGQAEVFAANQEAFSTELELLQSRAVELGEGAHHHVLVTETVPLYLLEAAGMHNVTPQEFTSAVEEGFDVPPAVMATTLEYVSTQDLSMLAYNVQTASAATERVAQAAREVDIPVVEFTETIPSDHTYLTWMSANLDALAANL